MIRLLQIEFQKLWSSRFSKVLILVSLILPFSVLILSSIKIDFFGFFTLDLVKTGIFNFPLIWHIITFFAGYFKFFFAFVVVSMVANEYSNRTLKQNLIDGLSKKEFILSKFFFILSYTLLSTVLIGVSILIIGLIHSSHTDISVVFINSEFLFAYFIKLLGFFSLCFFMAVLIKRSAFAFGGILMLFIAELIFYGLLKWKWASETTADAIMAYAPFVSLYKLIDQPIQRIIMITQPNKVDLAYDYAVHPKELIIVLIWVGIFIGASYLLLKRRDL